MKKTSALLSVLVILSGMVLTAPCVAQEDTMTPEMNLLQVFNGDFEYRATMNGEEFTGTLSMQPFGDGRFVVWDEVGLANTPNPILVKGWIGYDAERKTFIWRRIASSGLYDSAQGWLTGKTLTFVMDDWSWPGFPGITMEGGLLVRTRWIDISSDGWTAKWETSTPGGAWEIYAEVELRPKK